VWDSSIVVAKYFEKIQEGLQGKRCLDLSAGCGLVGNVYILEGYLLHIDLHIARNVLRGIFLSLSCLSLELFKAVAAESYGPMSKVKLKRADWVVRLTYLIQRA